MLASGLLHFTIILLSTKQSTVKVGKQLVNIVRTKVGSIRKDDEKLLQRSRNKFFSVYNLGEFCANCYHTIKIVTLASSLITLITSCWTLSYKTIH